MKTPGSDIRKAGSRLESKGWTRLDAIEGLRVGGPDAESFLQAQLTCDLATMVPDMALPFAWCTPSGRVRYSGWLQREGDHVVLLVAAGRGPDLARALQPYVMRAAVTFDAVEDLCWSSQPRASASPAAEPAGWLLPGSPQRLVTVAAPGAKPADRRQQYLLAGIRAGVFELPADLEDRFLPQMLNLDLIGGVSFTKGCYPGQEVVTRTHHLGRIKRRMLRFKAGSGPWPPGTAILAGKLKVGTVVVSARTGPDSEMLVVVQIDACKTTPLRLRAESGPELEPAPLPYVIPELA